MTNPTEPGDAAGAEPGKPAGARPGAEPATSVPGAAAEAAGSGNGDASRESGGDEYPPTGEEAAEAADTDDAAPGRKPPSGTEAGPVNPGNPGTAVAARVDGDTASRDGAADEHPVSGEAGPAAETAGVGEGVGGGTAFRDGAAPEERPAPGADAEPGTAASVSAASVSGTAAGAVPDDDGTHSRGDTHGAAAADGDASSRGEAALSASDGPVPEEKPAGPVGGTVPAWWTWVGRRRKPVLVVAALVVVALAATLVVVSVAGKDPKDVVRAYLDAIHARDTQAALEIAGEPADDRTRFLSADALAGGWSVEAVVERHVREQEADVDVTLRAGDTTQEGRFHMVKGDDGWVMESPFVEVDLTVGDLDVVELGGVRQPGDGDPATRGTSLLLFPGVYELYPGFTDIEVDPPLLIAAPLATSDPTLRVTAGYTLTEQGADAARKGLNAHIDECATRPVLAPPGCPFDLSGNHTLRELADVADVAWTVVTHPEPHFTAKQDGGVGLVVRKPGTVRVTGTAVPQGAARRPFTATCEFGLANLTLAVTPDGVAVNGATGDDYSASLSTVCF